MKYLEFQELWPYNNLLDGHDLGCTYLFGKIEAYYSKQTSQDKKLTMEIENRINRETRSSSPQTSSPLQYLSKSAGHQNNNNHPSQSKAKQQHLTVGSWHGNGIAIPSNQVPDISPPALSPPGFYDFSPQLHDDPFGNDKENRQTFVNLISTLNLSYPDYDFSNVTPQFFIRLSIQEALTNINNSLREVLGNDRFNSLWNIINEIIDLPHCEVYSYIPDQNQDDPLADPLSLGGGKLWTWNYFFVNNRVKRLVFFTTYGKSKSAALQDLDDEGMMVGEEYGSDGEYDYYYGSKNVHHNNEEEEEYQEHEMMDSFDDL
ncbi:hypothetical protein ABK040_010643 [Willaertia magna]